MTKKIFHWLFYCFLFAIAWQSAYEYLDNDLGWHLKAGQDILTSGQLISDQRYLWTLTDYQWLNHEWLSDVSIFSLYQLGGYGLLAVVFALLPVAAWLLVNRRYTALSGRDLGWLLLAWELAATIAMRPQLGIRVQLLALPFLAWLLGYCLSRDQRQPRSYLTVFILFYLWACLHGSFIFGLGVLGLFAINDYWRQRRTTLAVSSLLALLAVLLTPLGWRVAAILPSHLNGNLSAYISEWRPLYSLPIQYWQIALIGSALALTIMLLLEKRLSWRQSELWLLLLLVAMSIGAIRHFSLLAVSLPLLILVKFPRLSPDRWPALLNIFLAASLGLGTALILVHTNPAIGDPFTSLCRRQPCGAVAFIRQHPELLKRRWLNHYNFGGYLIWTLPEARLYADGRLPYAKRQQQLLVADFLEFNDPDKLADKLNRERIELILWSKLTNAQSGLSKNSQARNRNTALLSYLNTQTDWQLIYEDYLSVVYIRKNR